MAAACRGLESAFFTLRLSRAPRPHCSPKQPKPLNGHRSLSNGGANFVAPARHAHQRKPLSSKRRQFAAAAPPPPTKHLLPGENINKSSGAAVSLSSGQRLIGKKASKICSPLERA